MEIPVYGKGGAVVATALVDGDDWLRLSRFRWHLNASGFARRTAKVGGKVVNVLMHREVVGAQPGDGTTVRHRHGTLDNRRSNLLVLSGVTRASASAGVEG